MTLFFFFIYRYLYTLCTCFHACVFPTMTVRYEKGTKSAAAPQRWVVRAGGAAATHDNTQPARAKKDTAARTQRRALSPCTSTKTAVCRKHRYASPLSLSHLKNSPTQRFFPLACLFFFFVAVGVDLLKFFFLFSTGQRLQHNAPQRREEEKERELNREIERERER